MLCSIQCTFVLAPNCPSSSNPGAGKIKISPLFCPLGGLFVARQALSSLLSLNGSAEVLSLVPVERVKPIIQ